MKIPRKSAAGFLLIARLLQAQARADRVFEAWALDAEQTAVPIFTFAKLAIYRFPTPWSASGRSAPPSGTTNHKITA